MRPIPPLAATFVARHEGCRLRAYADVGGTWTIGYGHTGPDVRSGVTATKAQAQAWLSEDLEAAGGRLARFVRQDVIAELTPEQYSALISFAFNLGGGPSWTIWKRLNARAFDQAPIEMMRFVYVTDQATKRKIKVQGLVNRRAAEVALWSTREPGSVPDKPPSSLTRAAATPAAPTDPTPPQRSATLVTGALGVCSAVPVAAKSISDAVEPYKDASPLIGQVFAAVASVAAFAAVLVVILGWMKTREAGR